MKKEIIVLFFAILFCNGNVYSIDRSHAFEINQKLGMGINLGGCFEADVIGSWGVEPKPEYFKDMKAKGFSNVRLPIKWSVHIMKESPYTIDKVFMDTIRWAVNTALANGLIPVINIHNFDELVYKNPNDYKGQYLSIWDQIAREFQSYSDSLIFELLNEPHDNMTPDIWNQFVADGLSKIRETNPDRIVMITSADWGGTTVLDKLILPDDPNIILTTHCYDPLQFTHQGASWAGLSGKTGIPWTGTESEVKVLKDFLSIFKQYSIQHNVPIYVGEFGVYEKADEASRIRWTNCLCSLIREYNFSGAYWEYCASFGIYNPARKCYHTGILKALLPNKNFDKYQDCSK